MKKIIVLGSINMDLVVSADRAPEGGETLTGERFQTIPGGKGANQAVAIARQGGDVSMIARVGKDGFGEELVSKLAENEVGIEHIKTDENASSGVALIVVENTGQNRIIVVPGANGWVSPTDVDDAGALFSQSDFLVTQLEIPIATVAAGLIQAKSSGIQTVLNASPSPSNPIAEELLRYVDYLLVNEIEAHSMTGTLVDGIDTALRVAKTLQKSTEGTVILTLGDLGAVTSDGSDIWHTPAFKVKVVDTTAAGDAFTGGLVASLQIGNSLKEALIYASASGALAATKFGAQPSLPTHEETFQFIDIQE